MCDISHKSLTAQATSPIVGYSSIKDTHIENTRRSVASVVSNETTQLYWNVGNAVNTFVLQGSRAEYGKQIVVSVSRQLVAEYGDSFEEKNLRRRNI